MNIVKYRIKLKQPKSFFKVRRAPPHFEWTKLNTGGSVRDDSEHASYGGLLRDDNGVFLAGFACNLDSCTIMYVELFGILHGLQLAKSIYVVRLYIESDSNNAIHMLYSDCDTTHPCAPILHHIKRLI